MISGNSNYGIDSGGEITFTITNSTLTGNGNIGISISNSNVQLYNTLIAQNALDIKTDSTYGSLSGSNNLIGNGSSQTSLTNGVDGNIIGTAANPVDPFLGEWSEDSGTFGAPLAGSPVINAGSNSYVSGNTDVFGNTRTQGGTVDIGAVEGVQFTPRNGITYNVTSLEDKIANDGVLTFREAFEAANRNVAVGDAQAGSFSAKDTIRFANGLEGTIETNYKTFTIVGSVDIIGSGTDLLIFDGGPEIFIISAGINVGLSNMTITNGSAPRKSGGIYNSGTLTITNAKITQNSSNYEEGGGIYNNYGILTVTNSTISGSYGDGIYNNCGTVIVTDSTITENSSDGIYNNSGIVTVTNSKINENGASGITNFDGTATVTNSTINENGSYGIYSNGDMLTVTNSSINRNSNSGIRNEYCTTVIVTNSMIFGNTTNDTYGGGGIANLGTALTVKNSTITGNSATQGGGIYNYSGATVNLYNTIVAKNSSDIYNDAHMLNLNGSHNLIGDGSGQTSLIDGNSGNIVGTAANPIDPLLGEWSEDLSTLGAPLAGSPVIDAGDNSYATGADVLGNTRTQNGTVDIGAVEGIPFTPRAGVTYLVTSLEDKIANDGVLTFREALEAANRNVAVGDAQAGSFSEKDTIRFADGLEGTVKTNGIVFTILGSVDIIGTGMDSLIFDGEFEDEYGQEDHSQGFIISS
jgi:hypothetical protein